MDKKHFALSNSSNRNKFPEQFNCLKIGKEAVIQLDSDPFRKKSLRLLVNRGKKQGRVEEIYYCKDAKLKLEDFNSETTHGEEPQLKNLFQTEFTDQNRLFVLISPQNDWLAAVLLSKGTGKEIRTELLLRNLKAKTGVMEALIFKIYQVLREEGYVFWSLGAVPFVQKNNFEFTTEYFFNLLGRNIKYAYNYKGLFNFKNKFNPLWKDYYLLSSRKINLSFLLKAAIDTNLISLLVYKIKFPFRSLILKEN